MSQLILSADRVWAFVTIMPLDDVDVRACSIEYQADPCRGFLSFSLEGEKISAKQGSILM